MGSPALVKALFVIPSLTAGGAERVMITLMNSLDKDQFSPELVVINDKGSLHDVISPEIPFHCLKRNNVIFSLYDLFKNIKKIQPDIIVSTMAHMNFILLILKPFFPGTKFVVREAITPNFILKKHPVIAPFLKIAYRVLYRKANLVISPAQIIVDEFKNDLFMDCENHAVIPNPVDLNKIRGSENEVFEISDKRKETIEFISAGRLHRQKGYDRLIASLACFKTDYDWHLTIFGEGAERKNLEALIKEHNLQFNISLKGLSTNPWPYFTQSDCFLMPSRWEGLPNVILEALACGIPSIATSSSGGIAEIASAAPQDTVMIVDSMDEFIDTMRRVKPSPTSHYRKPLLPAIYSRQNVVDQFSKLLLEQ